MKTHRLSWLLLSAFLSAGCAATVRPVQTKSQLGSVIVYRNGVAYFERYAGAGEKKVSLRVPSEKVDDFLSSLSIIDTNTGEALPVSYPTLETLDGYVEMTISLPAKHGRLKISYVTESPAWKPSYRVVLEDGGKARLQGWAVVDNVSGEDWKNIKVGVGSTSALTFRYDLHSVRLVERQMLTTGEPLAHAPPTGGTPYAVATKKVRVIGALGSSGLAQVQSGGANMADTAVRRPTQSSRGSAGLKSEDRSGKGKGRKSRKPQRVYDNRYWKSLRTQAGQHRIRVEGFAQLGDAHPDQQSLARANTVRDQLIANGVPSSRIDVVGNTTVNTREAVRVLATDEERGDGAKADAAERAAKDTLPVGHAHFLSDDPMSIKKDHSAMVSMLNEVTQAKRVYYYDPISARGSKKFAFNAVRITNPSKYTLDAGPFTIYSKGQFLGEGLSEAILPNGSAFIPYALDRSIIIDPKVDQREEIERLVTIQRGVVNTETRRIRRTAVSISNRSKTSAQVFVRHKVGEGFTLTKASQAKVEKLNGAHLFSVDVAGGEAVELVIEEWTPLMKTVDIRTDAGIRDVGLYLRKGNVSPALQGQLKSVIASHRSATNLQEKIDLLDDQMHVYRTRIDEINVQLFSLRKVPQAAKLRDHLAKKMEEISNKLQTATLGTTDLKSQLMTLRIDLQDKLAELSLKQEDGSKVATN
jgi:hypothetical protein